jgi:hypothetical protein
MDGGPQIWDIPLTPAQRWGLVQLAFHNQAPQITNAAAGKKLRRALRAFGLMPIRDALRKYDGKANSDLASSDSPALHKITAENLECVLGWSTVPRHPSVELVAGEVFDLLEQLLAAPGATYGSNVPSFETVTEDWSPPPELEQPFTMTCPSCRQQFDLSELGAERRP